jgi:CheY-like chemotaxis protein
MKIFVLLFLLGMGIDYSFAHNCELQKITDSEYQCEIEFTPRDENYFLVFPKQSKIYDLKINHNSVVQAGQSYFDNLGGYILVAKSAYPIPHGFLQQTGKQLIQITWAKPPKGEMPISIEANVRSPATKFINYIPSSFVLTFILILLFIRHDFLDKQNFFQLSLLTGFILAIHLYLNSLEPYLIFNNWINHVSKLHVLTTSLSTVLLIQLSDNFLHLFKRKWYWSATIITLLLLMIAPWERGDAYTELIIQCLIPSIIITTLAVIIITLKIFRYKLYQKDSSYYPIIISGVLVALICVIDTLVAIYDKFGEPPISGYGLLLYYIIVNLTFIIRSKKMKINQLAIHEEVASVSRQVAHDIKSPLAALKMAIETFNEIPSDKKHFIKRSVERIDDIINDLHQKSRREDKREDKQEAILLMSSVINSVISEKRLTLNNKEITILNTTPEQFQLTFARANRSVIKRMISNLLNNAIEALPAQSGLIEIQFSELNQTWCKMSIKDNGKGIPPHLIEQIKQKHFTHDKIGGQGLGLSYVQEQILHWQGELNITSQVNIGTLIEFTLPRSHSPSWFCSSLNLHKTEKIFVVDDDSSIFELWKNKLQALKLPVQHIQTPEDFLTRLSEIDHNHHFIIIDLDYMGSETNGFQIISHLKHARFILSTSRFEESEVQNRCAQERIQILPKDFIQHILIQQMQTMVLIDNDDLICEGWKIIGAKNGIAVKTYSMLQDLPDLDFDTPIYIDYELEQTMNGIEVAQSLSKKGYTQLYLCTGHNDLKLSDYPFLRAIVGKDFPEII